jgi:hypothetical protein
MKTVTFVNIGRNKRNFAEVVPFATCDVIAKLAKKKGGLMSRDIDAAYDENADLNEKCEGTIFAGMRPVGRFIVT